MHLREEELIDLVEGAVADAAVPHLAACERCRRELAGLRSALADAATLDVPEPSRHFWDDLSARIGDAVAAEPPHLGWNWWVHAALPFTAAIAAALVIAFITTTRLIAPHRGAAPPPPTTIAVAPPPAANPVSGEVTADTPDPSLALVADLTQDFNFDEAREAGLAPRGSADHAVTHLSQRELRQLKDLLQAEMGKSSD
jgi:hypothetical protein